MRKMTKANNAQHSLRPGSGKIHEALYGEAQQMVTASSDIQSAPVFVCTICGHTVIGEASDKCPVCGALKEKYRQF